MCRLFGLIANKPVDVEFSFLKADKPFKDLGSENRDGWGIGYYENKISKVFKEPQRIDKSSKIEEISKYCISNIIISHVRKATSGSRRFENSHPFQYKNWLFAHNGSIIDNIESLRKAITPEYMQLIQGETDSETLFIWLMQNIELNGVIDGLKAGLKFIEECLSYTSLNFLLTDGSKLYALRKARVNPDYYSLYYLSRDPERGEMFEYKSKQTRQLILSKLLNEEKAIIICSEKLTSEENWTPIENNTLLTVDGNLKISATRL